MREVAEPTRAPGDKPPVRLVGGRYRIEDVVGTGAMGTVWRGYDTRLRRPVAVKEVNLPTTATDDQRTVLTRRAMAEARHAARVSHPNIVAVHDVVAESGLPFLVMRLVEGRSLGQAVRSDGPVSPVRAAQIGIALVDALSAAHRGGVVHRDVKPSNVLLTDDGEVLLTDFSIATDAFRGTMSAGSGGLGSPGYIAPERLNGQSTGPEADLFGLGATLFCAVEGYGPFDRHDPLAALLATATNPHPEPKRAGALAPLLDALLVKDPAERPDLARVRAELVAVVRASEAVVPDDPAGAAPNEQLHKPDIDAMSSTSALSAVPSGPTGPAGSAGSAGTAAEAAQLEAAQLASAQHSEAPTVASSSSSGLLSDGAPRARPGAPQHAAPRSRRRLRTLLGVLAVVICAAVVLAAVVLQRDDSRDDGSIAATASLAAPPSSAPVTPGSPAAGSPSPSTTASGTPTPTPSSSASASKSTSAAPSASPEPVGQVTGADLSVSPSSYLGSCANAVPFTVNLTVSVSDAPTDVRYTLSLAPGDSDVAGGGGGVPEGDGTYESSEQVGLEFSQGTGTYAVQAAVELPSRFSPVPAQISVICVG